MELRLLRTDWRVPRMVVANDCHGEEAGAVDEMPQVR